MGLDLGALARFAGNAAAPLATTVAAHNEADLAESERQRQRGLQYLMQQRQDKIDAQNEAIGRQRIATLQSQAGAADALANQRGSDSVEYKQNSDGEWIALPRRVSPGNPGIPRGTQTESERNADLLKMSPWTIGNHVVQPSAGSPANGGTSANNNPPPRPSDGNDVQGLLAQLGGNPQQSTGGTPVPARPTGVVGPMKAPGQHPTTAQIGGRPVLGRVNPQGMFSADTTARGDTVYARPPVSGRGASDNSPLNHAIVNVRGQIAQTQAQLRDATARAKAADDPLATPVTRAAATAAAQKATMLQQRLDSLTQTHDQLSAQQQRGLMPGRPAPASTTPSPTHGRLSPATARQMQDEFDAASNDLSAVMSSNAPPAVKKQANTLYQQHQAEIARKYGALPPGADDENE